MEEFFSRYRNLSVLLAVVFAQVILLGYQVRSEQGSSLLREWTVRAVTPVTKGVRGITRWAGSSWDNYFWLIETKQDNDRLRRELNQLKLENAELRTGLARFEREERLIAYQSELTSETILAQVIGRGANSNSREIFISRGLKHGVQPGMPVITPDGIAGKVQAAYPAASLVMLISDPEAGVGALLAGSRAGGIVKGTGHRECRMDYVSHEVDVEIGEKIYTSGDDRVFPKGLPIGEVVRLDRDTDFQEIFLKPFTQLDRLEEVLVITAGVHQNLPESHESQPPQFLMPPPDEVEELRAGAEPEEPEAATEITAEEALELGQNTRQTDADRLRRYYQSVAEQQGHRIGYGLPGSAPPEFNPERIREQLPPRAGSKPRPSPSAVTGDAAADAAGGSAGAVTRGSGRPADGDENASGGSTGTERSVARQDTSDVDSPAGDSEPAEPEDREQPPSGPPSAAQPQPAEQGRPEQTDSPGTLTGNGSPQSAPREIAETGRPAGAAPEPVSSPTQAAPSRNTSGISRPATDRPDALREPSRPRIVADPGTRQRPQGDPLAVRQEDSPPEQD